MYNLFSLHYLQIFLSFCKNDVLLKNMLEIAEVVRLCFIELMNFLLRRILRFVQRLLERVKLRVYLFLLNAVLYFVEKRRVVAQLLLAHLLLCVNSDLYIRHGCLFRSDSDLAYRHKSAVVLRHAWQPGHVIFMGAHAGINAVVVQLILQTVHLVAQLFEGLEI